MTDRERKFLDDARAVLDDSVRDLDGATRSRLAQARNAALDRKRRTRRRLVTWGSPVGLAAAAALLAVLFIGREAPVDESYVADLDLLGSGETIEFYEDLEFYEWLAETEAMESGDQDMSGAGSGDVRHADAGVRTGAGRPAERGTAGISGRVRG